MPLSMVKQATTPPLLVGSFEFQLLYSTMYSFLFSRMISRQNPYCHHLCVFQLSTKCYKIYFHL